MKTGVFSEVEQRGHEQVTHFFFPEVGLKAIVGIHNSVLGPALGGCRMRIYHDEGEALDDVLRLSEGMTYKSALAGLDLGGGKAVIVADPSLKNGRRELFRKFGECLNFLGGRYISAEDMGTSVSDIMWAREISKHVAGIAPENGGGGDPSPWTARGVYSSIRAACERRFKTADLKGRKVSVQGVGHVGLSLVQLLRDAGAEVVVSDTNQDRLQEASKKYGARVVSTDAIYDESVDVYAPCAMGQTVNVDTIKRLKCSIIAGAANNQLMNASLYEPILSKKILYCPDFVVNAGGVINVGAELVAGGYKKEWVVEKVDRIYNTISKVLDESERSGKFPEVVALAMAKDRIRAAAQKKNA